MPNNPKAKDNLVPCTSENARERQLKGAAKRKENNANRNFAIMTMRKYLTSKKVVTERDLAAVGENGELKVGKKATRFEILFAKVMASLENRSELGDRSVERDFAEILKACGAHFDQSKEALGGEENPINVNSRIGPPTDEYRAEMRKQAMELGVFDKEGEG